MGKIALKTGSEDTECVCVSSNFDVGHMGDIDTQLSAKQLETDGTRRPA